MGLHFLRKKGFVYKPYQPLELTSATLHMLENNIFNLLLILSWQFTQIIRTNIWNVLDDIAFSLTNLFMLEIPCPIICFQRFVESIFLYMVKTSTQVVALHNNITFEDKGGKFFWRLYCNKIWQTTWFYFCIITNSFQNYDNPKRILLKVNYFEAHDDEKLQRFAN